MRRHPLVVAFVALVVTGCGGLPLTGAARPDAERAAALHGTVRGLARPEAARVALYRQEAPDLALRMPSADAAVDVAGRVRTAVLAAGRYVPALRAPGHPVSIVRTVVPPAPAVTIHARPAAGAALLEIRRGAGAAGASSVVLSREEEGLPVVERHVAALPAEESGAVEIAGLLPGRWRVDVVGTGWTTEVDVPAAGAVTLLLDPPPLPPLGTVEVRGHVLRVDGAPAPDVAVTLRAMVEDTATGVPSASAWGRYALTDSDGGYHVVGVPAGRTLRRLECRDAIYPGVPTPEAVAIPPSGEERRSFVLGR